MYPRKHWQDHIRYNNNNNIHWEEAIQGEIYCYTGIVSSVDSVSQLLQLFMFVRVATAPSIAVYTSESVLLMVDLSV